MKNHEKKPRILPSPHLEGPQVPSIQAAEDKVVKVVFPADLPKLDSRGHHAFRPRDPSTGDDSEIMAKVGGLG